ncbi:MAG: FtsL-like putative cell division protein [Schleiferiaceae bacterium]|nr:FtsL-like putative cell division protein [Schleiferiaceae bacterium]
MNFKISKKRIKTSGYAAREILRGSFIGHPVIIRNLPFALYLTGLSLLAIWGAHRAESRVKEISKKVVLLNELESEYLEAKSNLMKMGTESSVRQRSQALGLVPSYRAPARITPPGDE